ncbi:aldehyde dehydrogenase family protein [Luteococcus sp.]|uniref:aldehyde dehydrogenase family protein n=1 Tax=Luteococcus sp. TaxID=1969402 RepID=UPI00264782B5|nr:aldehyde dehydrogenase family protein [Luteococcus sp.]
MMVESGKVPAGALQLVSGSARDLLDHLDMHDMVAFNGSAGTASKLKLHPAVTERGCHYTAETDSPNAAVLGSDVTVDSPEFDAFIKAIMVEMAVKASQKCTAIRRVVVPQAMVQPVVDALQAKISSKIVVGGPRTEGSTMGPLASLDQREEVAKAVNALVEAGGRIAFGHGSPVPHLVHGGPGRAGGGEDLGGVRAVKHCMQRLAVQGGPDHLTAITGIWHTGAATNSVSRSDVDSGKGKHPFRESLAELGIGNQFRSELRTVTLQEITDFAHETGDTFYAHTDEEAAMANPFFPRRVAHGYLLVSWAAGLFVDPAPGPVLANYGWRTCASSRRSPMTTRSASP